MNAATDYEAIFERYSGIMRTCELTKEGISYQTLQNLMREGSVEKIKYGYYQWQNEKAFTEASVICSLFPEAVICDVSAAMYYGYTDRTPEIWHIAVNNKSARNKFKLDFPKIKPHFIDEKRLSIGVSVGNIDGIAVNIYDRERIVCDCLRHIDTMDGEIFNTIIQRYVNDAQKDAARLMEYASKLGVEKKARRVIGIWL
ncbi:MAG: type IV toxin-antitoxin system AbiEi family antitoxin domain-containing protein [Lachnospiraceae bacterium]|nr:type IV toxin-antitoxin system AbiEi family antitoxin domain-containing protein [Lachnospiraceae bacterium]